MIHWSYIQESLWTYKLNIDDDFGNPIYRVLDISLPTLPILLEVLSDYSFALKINRSNKIFGMNDLSSEDQMDLVVASIHKLEDIDF